MRRRWLDKPLPDLRRRFKANRLESVETAEWIPFDGIDAVESPVVLIAATVLIVLLVLVVLPLLGVALELIGVLVLIGSGVLGRVLLGRPWIVEAVKVGDSGERAAYAVNGWRRSNEALRQLRTTLATSGPPERISPADTSATRLSR